MAKSERLDPIDISSLDQLIREGQLGMAREKIGSLNLKSIARKQAVDVANLARRLNMPKLMIKVLKPIVRPQRLLQEPASESEIALYATALSRLGVFNEAENLLKKIGNTTTPEVLLYHAMNDMFQWDYKSPIAKLKKYVQSATISDYERLVGYVNLAASYIWNMDWEKGRQTVEAIQKEITRSKDPLSHKLVHGYSFELLAEMSILQGKFTEAENFLNQAEELLGGSKSRYEFFLKKWKAIGKAMQSPESKLYLSDLQNIKKEALLLKDWETYRDCDFFEAVVRQDHQLFLKVYHGTPYQSFQKRAEKIFKPRSLEKKDARWILYKNRLSPSSAAPVKLSVLSLKELGSKPLLAELFHLLSRDFYRPVPFGTVISELYPDEFFNPDTSPQKAWQIVERLRTWFQEQNLPLDIEILDESCSLVSKEDCELSVTEINNFRLSEEDHVARMSSHFELRPFTSSEVAELFKITKRSAQKICQAAMAAKKLQQTSGGRSTKYRFKK